MKRGKALYEPAHSSCKWLAALCFPLLLTACAAKDVGPINTFAPDAPKQSAGFINDAGDDGALIVGVAFSGGGTRAAAFAYGVLSELDTLRIGESAQQRAVTDSIRMVSGTSGGAVAAAYFALERLRQSP